MFNFSCLNSDLLFIVKWFIFLIDLLSLNESNYQNAEIQLEQLERLHCEDTYRHPMITHIIDSCRIPSLN